MLWAVHPRVHECLRRCERRAARSNSLAIRTQALSVRLQPFVGQEGPAATAGSRAAGPVLWRCRHAPAGPASEEGLSERELEVLRLLATDLTGPEISGRLFMSVNTFRTHTRHIFTKLDVNTRRAVLHLAGSDT